MEQIEDFYTVYVGAIGISEEVFWNAPISFVKTLAQDKNAYESWLAKEKEKVLGRW